jgi:L-ascorbate metabolism protein UlaG (beta-lactamase superfamily)
MLATFLLASCRYLQTGDPADLHPTAPGTIQVVGNCTPTCTDSVDVVAMGVAGFLVVPWRDTTQLVLTAPLFTNPSVPWMMFGDLLFGTHPDTAAITRRLQAMPAANEERLSRVAAVVVGHGHYDHLMDIPPLASRLPNARVYGSETVANLLAPVSALRTRRVIVDSTAGRDANRPGTSYVVGSAVRLRAIQWAHAPNIGTITIAPGHQRTPRETLPRTVHGWKMGAVYGYVIDILAADSSVAFRLVFHDAAADADVQRRTGEVIATMPPAHQTIAMITAANFDQPVQYPDILLAHLAPTHVILGHWDDFFRSSDAEERVVRGIRASELVARLAPFVGKRWTAPRAGAITRFRW